MQKYVRVSGGRNVSFSENFSYWIIPNVMNIDSDKFGAIDLVNISIYAVIFRFFQSLSERFITDFYTQKTRYFLVHIFHISIYFAIWILPISQVALRKET